MLLAQRLALITVVATLILIAVGVVVRATGSGLGCPDWPTCYGGVLPPGDKHPVIEMSHRFVAAAVGLLVIALAVVCWRAFRHRPVVAYLAVVTVPLVGVQGLLGAITVQRELPPEIVATHLLTAFIVLSCLIVVAAGIAMNLRTVSPGRGPAVGRTGMLALAALAGLAAVVWLGGYMTESGASTACTDWPGCNGSLFPAADEHEIVHMGHRYLVAVLAVVIVALVWSAWASRSMLPSGALVPITLAILFTLQVAVGALNVWYEFPEWLAVSHTVIASLIWAHLTAVAALVYLEPGPQPASDSLAAAPAHT